MDVLIFAVQRPTVRTDRDRIRSISAIILWRMTGLAGAPAHFRCRAGPVKRVLEPYQRYAQVHIAFQAIKDIALYELCGKLLRWLGFSLIFEHRPPDHLPAYAPPLPPVLAVVPDAGLPAQSQGLRAGCAGQHPAGAGQGSVQTADSAAQGGGCQDAFHGPHTAPRRQAGAVAGRVDVWRGPRPGGGAAVSCLCACRAGPAPGRKAAAAGHAARLRPDGAGHCRRVAHEPAGGASSVCGAVPRAGAHGQRPRLLELV